MTEQVTERETGPMDLYTEPRITRPITDPIATGTPLLAMCLVNWHLVALDSNWYLYLAIDRSLSVRWPVSVANHRYQRTVYADRRWDRKGRDAATTMVLNTVVLRSGHKQRLVSGQTGEDSTRHTVYSGLAKMVQAKAVGSGGGLAAFVRRIRIARYFEV
jgi:hypothetical protein